MPPGRRTRLTRTQSQARTRQQLLDTAVEVFAERGLAGASVEEIAERAGYSKGAVYSNFASKTDLALAVLERRNQQQLHALATLIPALGDQPDFWQDQATTGSAGPWDALLAELLVTARYDPQLRDQLADQLRHVRTQAARIVAGGNPPASSTWTPSRSPSPSPTAWPPPTPSTPIPTSFICGPPPSPASTTTSTPDHHPPPSRPPAPPAPDHQRKPADHAPQTRRSRSASGKLLAPVRVTPRVPARAAQGSRAATFL